MSKHVFITGNSSGLGRGLTEVYLERGWTVFSLSRRGCRGLDGPLHDIRCDLSDFETIGPTLERLLFPAPGLELVILNAGVLGKIREISKTPLVDIQKIMDVNVWSNKIILDWLVTSALRVEQITLVSSGAAVNGNKGWGGYALSKAALNMLTKLYAHEFPDTHLTAFAPGLIDTPMQDYLCEEPDPVRFPALEKIRNARGSASMPHPREAAEKIVEAIPRFLNYPSGSFVDIRTM